MLVRYVPRGNVEEPEMARVHMVVGPGHPYEWPLLGTAVVDEIVPLADVVVCQRSSRAAFASPGLTVN